MKKVKDFFMNFWDPSFYLIKIDRKKSSKIWQIKKSDYTYYTQMEIQNISKVM